MASKAPTDTMLHVFYVNVGSMLKYELDATKNNVGRLQDLIARQVQISIDKQILLISGGENVCPTRKISTYSSGSDTTPFFLYHKNSAEVFMPPLELNISPSEKNLQSQLKDCLNKTISADLTALRANIVKSFYLLGRAKLDTCTDLVHSQHLQHQGWAVVIANLLDVTNDYLRKAELFMGNLKTFHQFHQEYHELLKDIPQVITTLGKITLPSCLPTQSSQHSSFNLSSSTSSTSSSSQHLPLTAPCKIYTLLDWINTHDSRNSLHRLVEEGRKSLEEFNEESMQSQFKEMEGFQELVVVDRKEMKVIRGLDDRLSGLDVLMANNKRLLKEQEDMAEAFHSVHQRMQSVQDASMLTELCASHKEYLERVHNNNCMLVESSYKCYKTKRELCENLNNRLRWVMLSEQSLWQADNRLLMRHKKLTKLRHNLHILHQIRSSTSIYCRSLAEVVRRRGYCSVFMKKASGTSSFYSEVHNRELQRRKLFDDTVNIQEHFLKALFPGLKDELPSFALKCPDDFDRNLPEVCDDTIKSLLASVPELAVFLEGVDFLSTDPLLTSTSEPLLSIQQSSLPTLQSQPPLPQNPPQIDQNPSLTAQNPPSKHTQTDNLYAARVINESNDKSNEKSNSSSLSKSYEFIQDKFEQAKLIQSADQKALLTVVSTSAYTTPLSTPPNQTTTSSPFQTVKKVSKIDSVAIKTLSSSPKSSPLPIPLTIPIVPTKSTQLTPDNSPIDSFLTADFYFDESMHSSDHTDPSTSKKVMELQSLLQERVIQLEGREKEIKKLLDIQKEDTQQRDLLVERYKKLAEFCFDGFDETKSYLFELKNDHLSFIDSINVELVINKNNFERLAEGVMNLLNSKETDIVRLSGRVEDLGGKLVEKDVEIIGMKEEWRRVEGRLELEVKRSGEVVVGKDAELVGMEGRYNKLVLESELEMEGLKCEFGDQLKEKENKIVELEGVVEKGVVEVGRVREEGEMTLKEARHQWEMEKKEENEAMEKNFEMRLSQKESEIRGELKEENDVILINKIATIDAEHKLKLAVVLADLKKLKHEVMCFKEDLQNNEFNDCVISDSTEFINVEMGEDDGRDEISVTTREVSEVFKHVRINLTSLLEQLFKLKEQVLVKEEEVCRLQTVQTMMPSVSSSHEHFELNNQQSTPNKDNSNNGDSSGVFNTSTSTSDLHAVISMQRHEELMDEMVAEKIREKNEIIEKWKAENLRFCEDLIANMKAEHDQDIVDRTRRLKCELEEQRQIAFNRALKQALRQRDEHITLLETQLADLKNKSKQLRNDSSHSSSKDKDDTKIIALKPGSSSQLPSSSSKSPQPKPRIVTQTILTQPSPSQAIPSQPSSSQAIPPQPSSLSSSSCSCSPSSPPSTYPPTLPPPTLPPPTIHSTMIQSCPDYVEKVHQLESTLKSKEEENRKLRNKLSSAKSSANDYVNIKTCTEGNIVLFTQDTSTQHYVAYLPQSPVKFFLHSDSLPLFHQAFVPMSSWLVAEVTGKDLCQAKKSSNRFRVPVGCKFYRVKAKPCEMLAEGGGLDGAEGSK